MRDIVIYGAGGFGKEIACLINKINSIRKTWRLIGFVDDGIEFGVQNEYGKILGNLSILNNWEEDLNVILAMGDPASLHKISNQITNTHINFPNIIAPDIVFFDQNLVKLGKGNIIGFKNIISNYVELGDFNILNNDVIIGHNVTIGSFNVFNPSVRISGGVSIGNTNLFGVSSVVIQNNHIGNFTRISPNSVVMRNTIDSSLYIGNPAVRFKY